VFEKSVSFRNARFYDSVFSRSEFLQDVDFCGAVFHTGVQFDSATFEGRCVFAGSWFNGRTSFASVTFSDHVQFTTALFEETVDFSGVAFNSGADFDMAVFKDSLIFQGANIRSDFSLANIAETGPSTVDGGLGSTKSDQSKSLSEIIRREDIELPSLLISEELQDNGFDIQKNFPIQVVKDGDFEQESPNFPLDRSAIDRIESYENVKSRFSSHDARQEAYRIQKLSFRQNARKRDADQMYVHEMRASRQAQRAKSGKIGGLRAVIEWVVADLSCKYGTDWQRVLLISLLVIGVCGVAYWVGDLYHIGGNIEFGTGDPPVNKPLVYFYYSVVIFTTVGGGNTLAVGLLALISAIEAVIGTVLSALLVAVFIRKLSD
jgi:hypothetical protein